MLDSYQRIWLVGASSGIGLALAQALDGKDRDIFVSARRAEPLNMLQARSLANLTPLQMDMTNERDVKQSVDAIAERTEGIDLLVVNAGICEYIDGPEIDTELVERVMETNFFGAVKLINTALPLLRKAATKKRRPKLVVMSSSVTYQALPRAHAYGASKAALRYFTECLKVDLKHEGIDVHIVSPGFVRTPLTDLNDFPMPFRIEASDAAERIIKGLHKDTFDIHFPKRFTAGLKLMALLPDCIRFGILDKLSRTPSDQSTEGNSGRAL